MIYEGLIYCVLSYCISGLMIGYHYGEDEAKNDEDKKASIATYSYFWFLSPISVPFMILVNVGELIYKAVHYKGDKK